MITVSGINSKKINDPVFLSARKFMVDRIAKLEAKGPSAELNLAKQRYTDLRHEDVMIEPPVSFNSGIVRCCFLSRKTGFFRADIEVEKVLLKPIFEEFSVKVTEYADVNALVTAVKAGTQTEGVIYLTGTSKYGVVVPAAKGNPDDVMKAMGNIYWDKVAVTKADSMDPTNKNSGTFTVEAINIDPTQGLMFFIEDLKAIAKK